MEESLPLVKNVLLLDADGKRVAVKFFGGDHATLASQLAFEKSLFNKTQRTNARGEPEVLMFDNLICVYKFVGDLMFFATGAADESELILAAVLSAYVDAVSILLRGAVEKRTVLENLDLVLLALDEIVDGGIVLETDPALVASNVSMRGAEAEVPLTEQTFSQALATAKEQLARSLLR